MWIAYNPNPASMRKVGDCSVRAVAKALDTDWETAFIKLCVNALAMGDMPNANNVISSVLRQNGFKRMDLPHNCPDCYTVIDFCRDHPIGTYILGIGNRSSGHAVAVVDGNYYDTWDSGLEIPDFYWRKE